jgi:ribosomal protein L11 methyltransferase
LLGEPFELVVANIIAGVHADLADRYPALVAGGGHLFLGGIVDERADIVLEAMVGTGWELIERIDEERWVGLVYERKE